MKRIHGTKYWVNLVKWWKKVAPPVRPSKADLRIYEEFLTKAIKNKKKPKILVLGATPEMRDLGHKFNAEITVCDLSIEMIIATSQLMQYKNNVEKEIWTRANWVTVPLQHNHYDIILGDGVTTNISWSEAKQWWKHLTELLKPNGVFITRAFFVDSKIAAKKIAITLIKKIFKKQNISKIDLASLNLALQLLNYNSKTKTVSTSNFKTLFFNYSKKFSLPQKKANKIYRKLIKIYPPKPIKVWRVPNKEQTENEAKRYFRIVKELSAPSMPNSLSIYFLKK